MIRTFDKGLINRILSEADIRAEFPQIKCDPKQYEDIYFLLCDSGLFCCVKRGEVMSCHAAITKIKRGKQALLDAREMVEWVLTNTDCERVISRADKTKKHLLHFNAKIGTRFDEDKDFIYYEVRK